VNRCVFHQVGQKSVDIICMKMQLSAAPYSACSLLPRCHRY